MTERITDARRHVSDADDSRALLRAPGAAAWAQLDQVLDLALDAPPEERPALVASFCGTNDRLRDAALLWLRQCERQDEVAQDAIAASPTFLSPSAAMRGADAAHLRDLPAEALPGEGPRTGTHAGAWRILHELGRGGMGVVYLAERADADPPMQAALKFMHHAVSFDDLGIRRFRDERRILAGLSHPAIARLLDVGVSDGLPWFAMEFVPGTPIDAWCDQHQRSIRERLGLFCRVCDAVQHAHARLVVHRDLKPANILVAADGSPTLLDFGIAKLLAAGDQPEGELTRPGTQPMTYAFAAPEQVRGDAPSTASDVYALGVLLHLLLRGQLPAQPARLPGQVGPPPATDASASRARAAAARSTTPARLERQLRGDLETIEARAMHHDAARRYPTADALAADIRRYLDGRPVLARRDTLVYRLRKVVTRHPIGSASAIGGTLTVVAFALVTAMQADRLRAQAEQLQSQAAALTAERDKATEVTDFLKGVLASADPYKQSAATLTLRDVLDRGAARADSALRDRPEVRAQLLSAMAPAYFGLGEWTRAGDLAQAAVDLRRLRLPPDAPELAASLVYLASVRLNQGRAAEAAAHASDALQLLRRQTDAAARDTSGALSALGSAYRRLGRLHEAADIQRALLEAERQKLPRRPERLAHMERGLAHALRDQQRIAEAAALYASALDHHLLAFGREHPESANSLVNLGHARLLMGDIRGALPLLTEGVAIKRRLLGLEHVDVAADQLILARALDAAGQRRQAAVLRDEVRTVERRSAPGDSVLAPMR